MRKLKGGEDKPESKKMIDQSECTSNHDGERSLSEGEILYEEEAPKDKDGTLCQKKPQTVNTGDGHQRDIVISKKDNGDVEEKESVPKKLKGQSKKGARNKFCTSWRYGKCRRGDKCPYIHPANSKMKDNMKNTGLGRAESKPRTLYALVWFLLFFLMA